MAQNIECVKTVEMHTGGEPLRIIVSGMATIVGNTLLDKIQYVRENMDHIRKLLMSEPRGHFDMYGVYLVEPDIQGAVTGCIFIHNEGYSTMCGHAVISLGRYLIDQGLVKQPTSPETKMLLQCPCGPVETFVEYKDGKTGGVRFKSVPSYLYKKDVTVTAEGLGNVTVDITYGGAFYAVVPAGKVGLQLSSSAQEFRNVANKLKEILMKTVELEHPESSDLAFLYGVLFTDDDDANSPVQDVSTHLCVFADKEIDRSPCGSGTTARVAQKFFRGLLKLDQQRTFKGPAGSKFKAKAVERVTFGRHDAVVVEVSGRGYYSGSCTFTLEADDEIGKGFMIE